MGGNFVSSRVTKSHPTSLQVKNNDLHLWCGYKSSARAAIYSIDFLKKFIYKMTQFIIEIKSNYKNSQELKIF